MAMSKFALACLLMVGGVAVAAEGTRPEVGKAAADFELADLQGTKHTLATTAKKGPVVLMVLRGFPGYQCPVCNKQVGQYLAAADKFKAKGATVLMVYPGPSKGLKEHAAEFVTGKTLPEGFHLLIDPDYTFIDKYDLRWDAPGETAYPSTFVIDKDRKVVFAKISKTHGDRAAAEDVLKALP
ncbi:MAG TPA: peroxiredoxin family protein [Caulifigura sp.]|jgi:peroxiredoxin|nr:peroxiredoxin family protein [Caulifigura sp.]